MSHSKKEFMDLRDEELAPEYDTISTPKTGLTLTTDKFITLDKGTIKEMAMAVVDDYTDGFKSPAEGLLLARKLEEFATQIKENIKDAAANELKLSKGEKANVLGATVTEQMTGVKYSFKDCNSPLWNRLNEEIKAEEAFLKTVQGSKTVVYDDEVVTVYEPVKSGQMSLIFKY